MYEELVARAGARGLTMAVQIREALEAYLADTASGPAVLRESDPVWKLLGEAHTGLGDGAARHDDYLYGRDE